MSKRKPNLVAEPAPKHTTETKTTFAADGVMLDALSYLDPEKKEHWRDWDIDGAVESVVSDLQNNYSILVVGAMGNGKSSIINAILGTVIFPMSMPGRANHSSDTECLVEFYNNPFMKPNAFRVKLVFKDATRWETEFSACSEEDPGGKRILRALLLTVDGKVDEDARNAKGIEINKILEKKSLEVDLEGQESVHQLLTLLCRTRDRHYKKISDHVKTLGCFPFLEQLLAIGDPWPFLQLVSVEANVTTRGILPPFCRLLDSPGLGGTVSGLTSIQTDLGDRLISEVWHLNDYERGTGKVVTLKEINLLVAAYGLENVKFIVNKADTNIDLIGETEEVKQFVVEKTQEFLDDIRTSADGGLTSVAMEQLKSRFYLVSAYGYIVGKQLPTFPLEDFLLHPKILPTFQRNPDLSRINELVCNLNLKIQAKITSATQNITDLISSAIDILMKQFEPQTSNIDQSDQLFRDCVEMASTSKVVIDEIKQFKAVVDTCRSSFKSALTPEITQSVPAGISLSLRDLHPQTCQAVIRRYGVFKINITELVWDKILAMRVDEVRAEGEEGKSSDFAHYFSDVFSKLSGKGEEVLRTLWNAIQEGQSTSLAQDALRKEQKLQASIERLKVDLDRVRQQLTSGGIHSFSYLLWTETNYRKLWTQAEMFWKKTASQKQQRTVEHLTTTFATPPFSSAVLAAGEKWMDRLQEDVINALNLVKNSLCQQLNIELYERAGLQTQDLKSLLELGDEQKLPLTSSDRAKLLEALKVIERTPKPNLPAVPPEEKNLSSDNPLNDPNWIKCDDGSCLLFRGICGLSEIDDGDVHPLLIPQQILLQRMAKDDAVAVTLAQSSCFALLEAFISCVPPGQDLIETCNGAQFLDGPGFIEKLEALFSTMITEMKQCDDPYPNAVEWVAYRRVQGFKADWSVAMDRQKRYSNTMQGFMSEYKTYIEKHSICPDLNECKQDISCPRGYLEAGADMQNWFHWRWLSPRLFLLPHVRVRTKLHANPFVSSSQNIQHALRYAAGFKKLRAGQDLRTPQPISYDASLKSKHPQRILGILFVFKVDANAIRTGSHINIVLQMQKKCKIKHRYGPEAEVTVYGGLSQKICQILDKVVLFAPDLSYATNNHILQSIYGINDETDSMFNKLRDVARDLVAANADDNVFRGLLSQAAGLHLQRRIQDKYKIILPFKKEVVFREKLLSQK